jgi:hypothetical protein
MEDPPDANVRHAAVGELLEPACLGTIGDVGWIGGWLRIAIFEVLADDRAVSERDLIVTNTGMRRSELIFMNCSFA